SPRLTCGAPLAVPGLLSPSRCRQWPGPDPSRRRTIARRSVPSHPHVALSESPVDELEFDAQLGEVVDVVAFCTVGAALISVHKADLQRQVHLRIDDDLPGRLSIQA